MILLAFFFNPDRLHRLVDVHLSRSPVPATLRLMFDAFALNRPPQKRDRQAEAEAAADISGETLPLMSACCFADVDRKLKGFLQKEARQAGLGFWLLKVFALFFTDSSGEHETFPYQD